MEKKKDQEKIREQFPPVHTPEPPQVKDVSKQPESGTKENEQFKLQQEQAGNKEQKAGKQKPSGNMPEGEEETDD